MKFLLCAPVILASIALLALGVITHPFAPFWPTSLIVVWLVLLFLLPRWWIAIYLALIPCLDLAPFSGWFFFEDFDFVTLCVLTVGYCQLIAKTTPKNGDKLFKLGIVALLCYAFGLAISAAIGLSPLPPIDANAFSHYFSRYNALRLLKGPFVAMLLLPIVFREFSLQRAQATRAVVVGMCAGLGLAALTVIWERIAFLDLTNLSADYRVTGFFAATHTGGVALEGYLTLSLPFAVFLLLGGRQAKDVIAGGVLTAVGLYSVVMTFTRALYAMIAVSLVVQVLLSTLIAPHSQKKSRFSAFVFLPIIAIVASYALQQVFTSSGYRGFAAVSGFFGSLFLLTLTPFRVSGHSVFAAAAILLVSFIFAKFSAKGVYIAYGMCLVIFVASYASRSNARDRYAWPSAIGLALNTVAIATHWGGQNAIFSAIAAIVLGIVVASMNALSRQRIWTLNRASVSLASLGMLGTAVTVVVMNSYFASDRFSATQGDWEIRTRHWQNVYNSMEPGPLHFAFGTGLGRMPESYFWHNAGEEIPGPFVFSQDGGNQFLRLSGSRYKRGYGESLRILQAVRVSSPRVVIELNARTASDAKLLVGICARHLIYSVGCSEKALHLGASPDWAKVKFDLDLTGIQARNKFLPRPYFLVLYTETQKSLIDIDNVNLYGLSNSESIRNGEFTRGLDHWYFSSDRLHLPWRTENIFLHVFFDQGAFGLGIFCVLLLMAFTRIIRPALRGNRGAIALALSLFGFVAIGMFDTLLDVPRLSLLFYVLLFSTIAIPSKLMFAETVRAERRLENS